MKLHTIGRHALVEGDCVEILRAMPADSFDACVSDPPYGLGFMGKAWDCDVPGPAFAAELLRVLKPGAHACLFGGTRTFHRLAVALEDAGFEIRDCLSWLYGTGFPKSLDVSKAIQSRGGPEAIRRMQMGEGYTPSGRGRINYDHGGASKMNEVVKRRPATPEASQWNGWGTALKPAWEPVLLVRKPLIGTVAANVLQHGTGGLNIDATRIGANGGTAKGSKPTGVGNGIYGAGMHGGCDIVDLDKGRWPANVVLDEVAAELLDAQSGESRSTASPRNNAARVNIAKGAEKANVTHGHADSGGASRFFYVAKPSRAERDRGCEHLPARSGGEATDRDDGAPGTQSPRAGGARNIHPTVKPAALIRWLVQLVTPPGGVVLDPFAGSGTIFVACEGLDVVVNACERDPEYVQIAIARGLAAP